MGPLSWRFVHASRTVAVVGLTMTLAGCAFAVWARVLLGGNWSGEVVIKQHHELVRRGPYASVRHPIYTGILLAMLGSALEIGELRGLVAVALAVAGWGLKARDEDVLLAEQFGEEFVRYRRDVRALIPFVW